MPKHNDIKKVLLIGAGPTAIGQTGEFDYAGMEVCRILKAEGIKVVVVENNPNTIISDCQFADAVYLEPLTVTNLERIISIEKPDSLLVGFGGQVALNLGYSLFKEGILEKYHINLLGIEPETIEKTENRLRFREIIQELELTIPEGGIAYGIGEGIEIGQKIGFPVVIHSSFAAEGAGVLVAYNKEELEEYIENALSSSPIRQALIEESLYGWQEIELELLKDSDGKVMVVSSMENIDPVGVHTGNSAVVIPAQSLSTSQYQRMVEISKQFLNKLGITGSVNFQFACSPNNQDLILLEVNPRFTKSTALVAKTSGVQIPAVAIKLALNYKLTEIFEHQKNGDGNNLQSDYVAVKLPRFNFEKFPTAEWMLGTSMKSVGEVVAFGGNFKEAFQKAIRSLDIGHHGLGAEGSDLKEDEITFKEIKEKIINPNADRWFYIRYALKKGMSLQEAADLSKLNHWFLKEVSEIVALEKKLTTYALYNLTNDVFLQAKQWGFSDPQLGYLLRTTDESIRETRKKQGIVAGFVKINNMGILKDNGASVFSTYCSCAKLETKKSEKILLPGSGPTRIGQGTEYDYSLVKASLAIMKSGLESIIINCNPASITTATENSSVLYIEPLVKEEILNIIEQEQPSNAILQFCGQAAQDLFAGLRKYIKINGTSLQDYNRGLNWNSLKESVKKTGLLYPDYGEAVDETIALEIANKIGYPVILKPSFDRLKSVEIIYDQEELTKYIAKMEPFSTKNPLLIEEFIGDAVGLLVTGVSDGQNFIIAGIMEQIEEAGINPGDSACSLPPYSVGKEILTKIKEISNVLAKELQITGLLNVKFAVKQDSIYLVDANPLSCLCIPFLTKATGIDWPAVISNSILGKRIKDQGINEKSLQYTAIREAAFSFDRFPGVDALLGPEVRSTGTAMAVDEDFGLAFIKAQLMVGEKIPTNGTIFLNIRSEDKRVFAPIIRRFIDLGFKIIAPEETATALLRNNIPCESVFQVGEGRPNIMDKIKNLEIQWIISTSSGRKTKPEEISIRSTAIQRDIPIITTISGTKAAAIGMEHYLKGDITVKSIEDYYQLQTK